MSILPEAYEDVDQTLLDEVLRQYNEDSPRAAPSRVLIGLDHEAEWIAARDAERSRIRAVREARLLCDHVDQKHQDDPGFFQWSDRRHDGQDFDYLLHHRHRFNDDIRDQLEIVAAKITHLNKDGSPGYFNKLERNIGWTDYITPILFSRSRHADDLARCGLWLNRHNSRRCHKTDFCFNCLWNDILKVLVEAFGSDSAAFWRAPAWSFITLGFTTSRKNSKAVGRGLERDDFAFMRGDHLYDPYPVRIGTHDDTSDLESAGWNDARILAMIIQEALDELYQGEHVNGYRNKLEGAFHIASGRARFMNIHGHTVCNGSESDMQFLADQLYAAMQRGLKKYGKWLNRRYRPDVLVLRVGTPEDLQRCIVYSEKVVAIKDIVAEAMRRPGAVNRDGLPNPAYVEGMQESLRELIDDDIENIFTGFNRDPETRRLQRRKTVGNMRFSDTAGACIGDEPEWHAIARRKDTKRKKDKRAAKAKRDEELDIVRVRKPRKRRRKCPRRFSRSMQRRNGGRRLAFDLDASLRFAAKRVALSLGPFDQRAPRRVVVSIPKKRRDCSAAANHAG